MLHKRRQCASRVPHVAQDASCAKRCAWEQDASCAKRCAWNMCAVGLCVFTFIRCHDHQRIAQTKNHKSLRKHKKKAKTKQKRKLQQKKNVEPNTKKNIQQQTQPHTQTQNKHKLREHGTRHIPLQHTSELCRDDSCEACRLYIRQSEKR